MTFNGKVVYKTGYTILTADDVDSVLVKRRGELMKEVCGKAEPHMTPSFGECHHCATTLENCADRVGTEKVQQGESDEF